MAKSVGRDSLLYSIQRSGVKGLGNSINNTTRQSLARLDAQMLG